MPVTAFPPGSAPRPRSRSLAHTVVEGLADRIRSGHWPPASKLPSESAIMGEFGVSRTVVREALSKLQAAGLVSTRHGVGTFVEWPAAGGSSGEAAGFRIDPAGQATLRDVVAVLELRIGVETEAAGLAAQRRTLVNLAAMRQALDDMAAALSAGDSAVAADFQFHFEITRATQNTHFSQLMAALGPSVIPRGRLDAAPVDADRLAYLRRVQAEHESILDAIAAQDADAARAAMRTHLVNSRERRRRAAASAVLAAESAGAL